MFFIFAIFFIISDLHHELQHPLLSVTFQLQVPDQLMSDLPLCIKKLLYANWSWREICWNETQNEYLGKSLQNYSQLLLWMNRLNRNYNLKRVDQLVYNWVSTLENFNKLTVKSLNHCEDQIVLYSFRKDFHNNAVQFIILVLCFYIWYRK